MDLRNTSYINKNASDFDVFFNIFYEKNTGYAMGALLHEHLVITAKIIEADKTNNAQAEHDLMAQGTVNADKLATVLNHINPLWALEMVKQMLHEHLRLTQIEISSYVHRQYGQSIQVFDQIEKQSQVMARMFAEGLINQFKLV